MPRDDVWEDAAAETQPENGDGGLSVQTLSVAVRDRMVLRELSLDVPHGETHVIFGPNGAGKSTLLGALLGAPQPKVVWGDIRWHGESLLRLSVAERVGRGLGMAFQRPPAVSGLRLRRLAELIVEQRAETDEKRSAVEAELQALAERLDVLDLLDRDVNQGFSGGELKRSEIFQVALQNPSLVMLDEPESGVDVVNIDRIGKMLRDLLQRDTHRDRRTVTGLIITHSGHILNYVNADLGHVLSEGRIICSGNARDVYDHIKEHGFDDCRRCVTCQGMFARA
jgi:Fe-S cluster assembly ATP-binding protein